MEESRRYSIRTGEQEIRRKTALTVMSSHRHQVIREEAYRKQRMEIQKKLCSASFLPAHATCASSPPRTLTASLRFFSYFYISLPFPKGCNGLPVPLPLAKILCHRSPLGENAPSVEGRYCSSFHVRDSDGPKLPFLHQHFWCVISTPVARLTGRGGGQTAESSSWVSFQTCRQHITKQKGVL